MTRRFSLFPVLPKVVIAFVALASTLGAQDSTPPGEEVATRGLVTVDWILIGIYLVSTIGLGWYMGRQQKTAKEYFVGRGNMHPMLVGISLFATLLSTISYLSGPGETIGKGPVHMASVIAYPFVYLVLGYLIVPVLMRRRVTSAYELLEEKLGVVARLFGAVMFILLRLVWMSLLVYLASKAVVEMLGVEDNEKDTWIPRIVMLTGFVSVLYTSLGGLRAVVITDLVQALLLLGGALVVIGLVTVELGGFSWFPTSWQVHWDSQPIYSFDPTTRVTIVGTLVSVFLWNVCTMASDQTSVQRYMATADAKTARRATAVQLVFAAIVMSVLALVGFALMGYFQQNPGQLPPSMELAKNADDIFPRFIAFHLPPGVSGLVVAAMFAAAMSSIDSGVNSITAVVSTDFLERFGIRASTERRRVWSARGLAFGIGALVVFGSTYMGQVPGNILVVTPKTNGLLVTPLFGLFFFALFVPFATQAGAIAGAFSGFGVALLVAFSGPIFGFVEVPSFDAQGVETIRQLDPISFQWVSLASLLANFAVGSVVSWLTKRSQAPA